MESKGYRYKITWKTKGISDDKRRADISYTTRNFTYKYGRTIISISFDPQEVVLLFESDSLVKSSSITNIVNDVLEKIYIIYTMMFSYGPEISEVAIVYEKYDSETLSWVAITNIEDPIDERKLTGSFLVRGAFSDRIPSFDTETWTSDETISAYLNLRKTSIVGEQGKLKSAVYAWIMSKSKESAIERFQYLWIAYNAMYFHYGRNLRYRIAYELKRVLGRDTVSEEPKSKKLVADKSVSVYSTSDEKAVENIALLMGGHKVGLSKKYSDVEIEKEDELNATEINRIKNGKAGEKIEAVIKEYWDGQRVTWESLCDQHIVLANAVGNVIKNGDSNPHRQQNQRQKENAANQAYSFLITTFNYSCLRCKLFHGGGPIPLFAHVDDAKVASLEVASGLVEDLLEKYLFPTLIRTNPISDEAECKARLAILVNNNEERASQIFETKFSGEVQKIIASINKTHEKQKKTNQQTPQSPSDTSQPQPDTAPSAPPSEPQA